MSAAVVVLAVRYLLVMLFFPFSALDKMLNFRGAVAQAEEIFSPALATAMIVVGLGIEIVMPLAILGGVADRAAALVMASYCAVTALLFKRFWQPGDFFAGGDSKARGLFWDFLKNFSLAGGFLLLTVGITEADVPSFFAAPFASTLPYSQVHR